MANSVQAIFKRPQVCIGMVHVGALPSSPLARKSIRRLADEAADEARKLARAGFDGVLIENMHDAPYVSGRQHPAVTAGMTAAACAVREAIGDRPLGVQVLSCGHEEAIAVCLAAEGSFIRVENYVFSHVADEGLMPTAEAGRLLRYRAALRAEHVRVFCDLDKKHASHAITADLTLADQAEAAQFFRADGVIVTGLTTGRPTDPQDLQAVRDATSLPLLVGSGVTPANIATMFKHADAVIIGSSIKRAGRWDNPVDPARAAAVIKAADRARR
jgi:membrane complex biogenesis BtpA family protein